MSEQPRKSTLWQILSFVVLLLADALLLWGLYRVRLSRSALFGTELFSPEFLALFAAALVLAIGGLVVLNTRRITAMIQAQPILWLIASII
ncbi:MAG: hypothetical protein KC496_16015, partial [Anaerolineae bacterium]|nr:hypothetical protein [Anaerolineae bacterium]